MKATTIERIQSPSPQSSSHEIEINKTKNVLKTHTEVVDDSTIMAAEIEAAAYMANFENIIADGKEPCMTKAYKPQVANQFENYLNPKTLKRHVLNSEKVRQIIEEYGRETNIPIRQIEKQVKEIIDEIGLDRNLAIIRWCGIVITRMGKRITSGIYVNSASMAEVKQNLGKNPVLYLPSHRSYMDFILMSYICYYYEIEIPGIAAGMDFHSMFMMGTMLRKTGAFFMRRSFSNDELYWDIFREYMYALVAAYHIGVEFFIEGTRSRNFKALMPKVGILSMALLPYFTGEVSDVTIVPVSVSYERVLEEQLFVYELLGVPKPKETTKGFFKALKIIDERFGRMYMDFGKPISAREFFGHTSVDHIRRAGVGANLQKLNKREIELVKKLANEVIYQQQRRIVITTFNLISLYYASQLYCNKTVNLAELENGVGKLKKLFEQLGAHVATNLNMIKPEILDTVEIHSNIVHFTYSQLQFTQVKVEQLAQEIDIKRLKAHALAPQTMAIAVPTLALQLYINPCLFWLAKPAFLILAGLQLRNEQLNATFDDANDEGEKVALNLVNNLRKRATELNEIFKHEFIIESSNEAEEFKRNLKFLNDHKILRIPSTSTTTTTTTTTTNGVAVGILEINENEASRVILSALAPFLCIYYQLSVTLNQLNATAINAGNIPEYSSKDVLIALQKNIENLLLQDDKISKHVHPYCLALDNLNIALNYFIQEGYLTKQNETGLLRPCTTMSMTTTTIDKSKSLIELEERLYNYCELMPFKQYYEANSGQIEWLPSKL